MVNLSPLSVVVPLLAALLVSAAPPAAAAERAAVPPAHVKECADAGLRDARSMTLVSSHRAKASSGKYSSRARAWVYAVPGATSRCIVVQATGAKVARRDVDYSVGHLGAVNGHGVLDTGEVLPINDALFSFGGATGRTRLMADVEELVEQETIPAEAASFYPPSLAGLAGHDVTATLTSVEYDLFTQAWTSKRLAQPMTKSQRKKKLTAAVAVAKKRYAARVAEATAARDEQLAQAAATTGLAGAWLTFAGETDFDLAIDMARESLRADKQLARRHAREAGQGTDTREAYAHEMSLVVPLS